MKLLHDQMGAPPPMMEMPSPPPGLFAHHPPLPPGLFAHHPANSMNLQLSDSVSAVAAPATAPATPAEASASPVHETYSTNNNIGVSTDKAKKGRVVSLWAFALITILIIVLFALCSLWCRRQYKKHLLEQKLKQDKENENKGKDGLLETDGDPDKQEGFQQEN